MNDPNATFSMLVKITGKVSLADALAEMRYLSETPGERINGNIDAYDKDELAAEFGRVAALVPSAYRADSPPGILMTLCAPRGEVHSSSAWKDAVESVMMAKGLDGHQHYAVLHSDFSKSDIEHVHIVANAVAFNGTYVHIQSETTRIQSGWWHGNAMDSVKKKEFAEGQKVYFGRGPMEFVGEVVEVEEGKVKVRGVETGCLHTEASTVEIGALDNLTVIDEGRFAYLTLDEPLYMSRDRFMDLHTELDRLEMSVAEGKQAFDAGERLLYLHSVLGATTWQMHPDYGCVRGADIPVLDTAEKPAPGKAYMGEIVAAPSPDRLLQNIGKDRLVLHDAAKLGARPDIGERVTVQYDGHGVGRIAERPVAKDIAHVRG